MCDVVVVAVATSFSTFSSNDSLRFFAGLHGTIPSSPLLVFPFSLQTFSPSELLLLTKGKELFSINSLHGFSLWMRSFSVFLGLPERCSQPCSIKSSCTFDFDFFFFWCTEIPSTTSFLLFFLFLTEDMLMGIGSALGTNPPAATLCLPFPSASTTISLSGKDASSLLPSSYLIRILCPPVATAVTRPPYHFTVGFTKRTFTLIPTAIFLRCLP
mmetsp:Transcript_27286/g.41827  ORF Transcript_27286/g.41827 Transcript_27286/m.41827 type:complete len:214 (-) Transcript_27286:1549-2190(-)